MNKFLERRILTIISDEEVGAGSVPAIEENGAANLAANTTNNDGQTPSVEPEAESKSAETSTKKSGGKASSKTDPPLTQEQIDALKHETEVFDQEVERILADPRYHAVQMPNGRVVMDLTAAHKDGIQINRFDYNRTHGKDEGATGKSLRTDGAQHPLLVVPVRVAKAAGLPRNAIQVACIATQIRKLDNTNTARCGSDDTTVIAPLVTVIKS